MNLQEIANRAGVSRMTVSRALRNQPRVSARTRQRILKIAKELNYQPSPMVSVLMSHIATSRPLHDKAILVCILPSSVSMHVEQLTLNPTANAHVIGARQQALQQGFDLEILQVGQTGMSDERFSSILRARVTQGVLILPSFGNDKISLNLDWGALSSVAIGYSMNDLAIHRVCLDYHSAMLHGLEKLWSMGFRHFGLYMESSTDERIRHLWASAFLTFHWNRNIPIDSRIKIPDTIERTAFVEWLTDLQPEVLISHRDHVIAEWYTETIDQFPHRCQFVHLDLDQTGSNISNAGFPGKRVELGATAVDMLIAQIKRGERDLPQDPKTCLIEPTLTFTKNNSQMSVTGNAN